MSNTVDEQDLPPLEYLPEPDYDRDQDEDTQLQIRGLARLTVPQAPRNYEEAREWWVGQIANPIRNWNMLCQMFSRMGPGCPGGFSSAWLQWVGMPDEYKVYTSNPDAAPGGAIIFSKGSSVYGHAMPADPRPFSDGTKAAISTNARRSHAPDRVGRRALLQSWGHRVLGYGWLMNGMEVDFKEPTPPAQTKRYKVLKQIIENLKAGREVARRQNDKQDIEMFNREIDRFQKMYQEARRF